MRVAFVQDGPNPVVPEIGHRMSTPIVAAARCIECSAELGVRRATSIRRSPPLALSSMRDPKRVTRTSAPNSSSAVRRISVRWASVNRMRSYCTLAPGKSSRQWHPCDEARKTTGPGHGGTLGKGSIRVPDHRRSGHDRPTGNLAATARGASCSSSPPLLDSVMPRGGRVVPCTPPACRHEPAGLCSRHGSAGCTLETAFGQS